MFASLPDGFQARPPRDDDAQAIADLINATAAAFGDVPDTDAESVREDWTHAGFTRDTDAQLVTDHAGRVVGYEWLHRTNDPTHVELDGYVHPDHMDRGIGTWLIGWAEARAGEVTADLAPETPVTLRLGTIASDEGSAQLFTEAGYGMVRHFWRMEIQLDEPPPAPELPAGIAIRAFVPGQDDRATYQAVEESFSDHWGHSPEPYEQWAARTTAEDWFDPALCFLALEGDQVAGVTLGRPRGESGWVRTVGVRRPWRRRGLAMALLLTAFRAFYDRGIRVVGLGVDAQSLTGATRVYERAGMFIRVRYDVYEKAVSRADLTAGRESAITHAER